jgi:hypothetical protein
LDDSVKSIMIGDGALSLTLSCLRYILPFLFKIIGYILGGVLYSGHRILIDMGLI